MADYFAIRGAGAVLCAGSTMLLPFSTTMIGFASVLVVWDFAEGVVGSALAALAAGEQYSDLSIAGMFY